MRNFFLAPECWHEPYTLEGQEAMHLSKVLRIKSGELICLLDGAGQSGIFAVTGSTKNKVGLSLVELTGHQRPESRCFLAAANTKAARKSWLLEKAVELEAGGVWFWQAERSQVKLPEHSKANWQEQLISGAKQCFNPWLPEIRTFTEGATELVGVAPQFSECYLLWEDANAKDLLTFEQIAPNGDTLFVLGPEGGLSAREVDIFTAHRFKAVSLGKRILRWETAALLCLGLVWWARELQR